MDDLINRQAAIDQLHQSYNLLDAEQRLEDLPSAQPEIIRCKDCINYTRGKDEWGSCFENPMKLWRETDYCSWAERRTDETD